jgi:hypothetical protein
MDYGCFPFHCDIRAVFLNRRAAAWYRALLLQKRIPFHLRTEAGLVSETFCSLEFRTVDEVPKLSNPNNDYFPE